MADTDIPSGIETGLTDTAPTGPPNPVAVVDLGTPDVDASAAAYARLLGLPQPTVDMDVSTARIRLRTNTSGDQNRILFGVPDADGHVRLLRRRGLDLSEPTGAEMAGEWHVDTMPFGVTPAEPVTDPARTASSPEVAADIAGIDHLVFSSPDRNLAVALFGATLGLDFRLDRRVVHGLRHLFFRLGDLVIEVVVSDSAPADEPIRLWGVAWGSTDMVATHRRLTDAGVGISEVREGRAPGTTVATINDDALATRSIIIGTDHPRPTASVHDEGVR
ncbi:glyoxalase/bleomycin resistance/dioxygenase family protein [Gordonia oryzae]|uniref:Glyoxalase/bleomycin resistance/dioxygenase family protein n=1 Tax=Gordonia oryzae TaxID=2487349 RepID=A0A3N4GZT0_9ACTN|nr:VOC family protein [Gordonia oryzae]RPA66308.1 glyoxalase/bleomycin resistance/dioxygenase family protein [Gordonia oryzae]